MDYRFNVWTPTGTPAGTRLRDFSFVLSAGLRMQLTPEGDCKEASFRAKGSGIQIPPLSAVQIEYLNGFDWTPIYYGQVRIGGNQRDVNGENYTLRSVALRFYAVTLSPGFSTPQQAAHLTVFAIVQDLIDSGQLASGSSPPTYYGSGIVDLGFDCRAIVTANQQNAGALLDQIVQDGKGLGVDVRWGIGPDQVFFCRPAKTDTLALQDLSRVVWKEPVAETPCTAVLWYVARKPDGAWLTYTSKRATSDPYGIWTKPVSLDASVNPWATLPGTYEVWARATGAPTWALLDPQPTFNTALLTDGVDFDVTAADTYTIPAGFNAASLTFKPTGGVRAARYTVAGEVTGDGNTVIAPFDSSDSAGPQQAGPDGAMAMGYLRHTYYPPPDVTRGLVTLSHVSTAEGLTIRAGEFRAEALNVELLDRLAQYHYATPAIDPADLSLPLFIPPAGLSGRVSAGTYDRAVDAWEYRISADRGLEVAALTGQADDPAQKARADLIKANDGKATATAITAQR